MAVQLRQVFYDMSLVEGNTTQTYNFMIWFSWVNGNGSGGVGNVKLRDFIMDIKDILARHVPKVKIQFVPRSANASADFLARQGASSGFVQEGWV
ncbi:hypothetical protein Ddye_023132 [Dipteronia dyeriana]|uniref:Uncharacterized protein n=1 Tax=Dipteronia dyeriana TaxID=168575 RepID=A0AAD9WRU7_9ROSI|nr:hypothetical protein Ddye_023132 [Dipteronia dyeriana]